MAITTAASAATAASPVVEDLSELGPVGVLARLGEAETAERRAGLAKLELALRWSVLHPPSDDTGTAVWGDAEIPGLDDCEDSLGGDGCPAVSAFAPEPFAAALGVSTFTGMQLLADALDLAHRLPATWARARALAVAPWKARRLAQATRHLSQPAAAHVDAQLADRLDGCGAVLIDRTVAQAARFDPDPVELAEQEARRSWHVHLTHRRDGSFAGTSHLEATGDTLAFTRFYDLVCDHAHRLAELGDADSLGARKGQGARRDRRRPDPPRPHRRPDRTRGPGQGRGGWGSGAAAVAGQYPDVCAPHPDRPACPDYPRRPADRSR
jgi:hypothetical protein